MNLIDDSTHPHHPKVSTNCIVSHHQNHATRHALNLDQTDGNGSYQNKP